jgi:hypothetical protein
MNIFLNIVLSFIISIVAAYGDPKENTFWEVGTIYILLILLIHHLMPEQVNKK